ncbi:SOS response-associated peptidase [Undibacterium sp. SXout11W]|uniref:SOS response-associated peptidase n=1 Tax=Undibacterium sp. SXout11W TaxID=3413050 RepID=UPI003BF1EFC0
MCVNYTPTRKEQLAHFNVSGQHLDDYKLETWQDYSAPIIRHHCGKPEVLLAAYSMIPKSKMPPDVKRFSTMNARAETIGQLRSYAKPWRESKLCLVPMQHFYEPCYESGKAERWEIGLKHEDDFAVAALYREWPEENGAVSYSFTQITINADEHTLMKRMHRPGDEKRSLVIVPRSDYDEWLSCTDPEFARTLLQLYPAELMQAHPVQRIKKSESASLFD